MLDKLKQITCPHDYRIINSFIVKSEFDIVLGSGKIPHTNCSLTRVYVTDFKCCECGKLKRKKVKTPK